MQARYRLTAAAPVGGQRCLKIRRCSMCRLRRARRPSWRRNRRRRATHGIALLIVSTATTARAPSMSWEFSPHRIRGGRVGGARSVTDHRRCICAMTTRTAGLLMTDFETIDETAHGCPACGDIVLTSKPACGKCWKQMPRPLRAKLAVAYRLRVRDHVRYQECLAELLSWCRDRRVRDFAVSS